MESEAVDNVKTVKAQGHNGRKSQLNQVLESLARESPSHVAVVDGAGTWTAFDILNQANNIELQLRLGERLAVVADEYAIALASLMAALRVGGSIVFVSPHDRDVDAKLRRYDASAIVVPSAEDKSVTESRIGDRTVAERNEFVLDNNQEKSFTLLKMAARYPLTSSRTPLIVFFTSGTTGVPKMVAHSEASLLAGYRLIRGLWFEMLAPDLLPRLLDPPTYLGLGPWFGEAASLGLTMTYLSGMPIASIGGLSLGLQALLSGGTIMGSPCYTANEILETICTGVITGISVAPITAQMLVRLAQRGERDLSSLFVVGLGGSSVPPGFHRQIEEVLNCRVVSGYGTTELGGVVATSRYSDPDEDRWSALGRPTPGVRLRLENGELLVQTPALAAGYLSDAGNLEPFSLDDGWYRTSDMASTPDGERYRFEGRLSGVIVRGGRKIRPERIESAILKHPNVEAAAVIGVPSNVPGEEDVVACVVVNQAVESVAIRQWCTSSLGKEMSPQRVRIVEGFPLGAGGKVDKVALRKIVVNQNAGRDYIRTARIRNQPIIDRTGGR